MAGLAAAVLLGLLVFQTFAPVALGDVMVEAWGLLFDGRSLRLCACMGQCSESQEGSD